MAGANMRVRRAKVRHFGLTVAVCAFALTMANLLSLLVPRRFGLAADPLGSAPSWFTGRLFDLPLGLAATMWLLMVLVGFAWRSHTGYRRGVLAWLTAAGVCVMFSLVVGVFVHSIPLSVMWFVLPEVLLVASGSTVAFASAGVVGVWLAHVARTWVPRHLLTH